MHILQHIAALILSFLFSRRSSSHPPGSRALDLVYAESPRSWGGSWSWGLAPPSPEKYTDPINPYLLQPSCRSFWSRSPDPQTLNRSSSLSKNPNLNTGQLLLPALPALPQVPAGWAMRPPGLRKVSPTASRRVAAPTGSRAPGAPR